MGLAHALGVHRDPSRGRTHIVIRYLEWTPKLSKDIQHRFRVSVAGVFKLADVYGDLDYIMNHSPGGAKKSIDEFIVGLDRVDGVEDRTPLLDLMICEDNLILRNGTSSVPNFVVH